ncbi:HlyD family efflux transporter periplasmic adaptor subunit [Puteibacter caeruleilacunae]|nr:HlyD family efflux transporter periplasmic adaptor subunit [Puteibacter caeruleilacunae]
MPEISNIHSEEVQELMGQIPGRLLRWGLAYIFGFFMMIIVGSYFYQYPKVVEAPITITTINPPASLYSKSSGRIDHWFVHDGDQVNHHDQVALIQNTADYKAVNSLERFIDSQDTCTLNNSITHQQLPALSNLGDLQSGFNKLIRDWNSYQVFISRDYLQEKIKLAQIQLQKQEENYQLLLRQQGMINEELKIQKKNFSRYQSMQKTGGISESEMDDAEARLMQSKRGILSFEATVKSAEISLVNQRQSIVELKEQYLNQVQQFEQNITDDLRTLKNQITTWKDHYLVESPIEGKVTLTEFWSENHVIRAGERLATIIPADSSVIVCMAYVPHAGIGSVKQGQPVNIKLAGFPFMEYGILRGNVKSISLVPEEKGYVAVIELNKGMLSTYEKRLKLVQEMDGTAEIITERIRAINRFIKPLEFLLN